MILPSIPDSSVDTIKDGARSIAEVMFQGDKLAKRNADTVGATIRRLLQGKGEEIKQEALEMIQLAIAQRRAQIIALLSEKECIRKIAGATKHNKVARTKLAEKVLDELAAKIPTMTTC